MNRPPACPRLSDERGVTVNHIGVALALQIACATVRRHKNTRLQMR